MFSPRRMLVEPLESRNLLDASALLGGLLSDTEVAETAPLEISGASGDLDWQDGLWGVKVTDLGTPNSSSVTVDLPDQSTDVGNALEVYYAASESDIRQFWVFLTDGFWRQVSYNGTWGTSSRLFRYYSSGDRNQDVCRADRFRVMEVTAGGQLRLTLDYHNDDLISGDQFDIHAEILLDRPTQFETAANAEVTVTNVSGRDVTPSWQGHRQLAEQWEIFGLSSMYVDDNLTGGLPGWYDSLDPDHDYVGNTSDAEYLNDGFSVNGQFQVSTHDVKRIDVDNTYVDLDHDAAICPPVVVPEYPWYEELVMLDQPGREVSLTHLYDPARNQRVKLLGASGITDDPDNLKWSVTYDRDDGNMVDGDNVQVKLGIDDFLDAWPDGASQSVRLRLITGTDANVAIGAYSAGSWYLDTNNDMAWTPGDGTPASFGWDGAIPTPGDWNGDGVDEMGVYKDGAWFRDLNGNGLYDDGHTYYGWADPQVLPVVGDWNGDGIDDLGIYKNGVWFRDLNGNGLWDSADWQYLLYLGWEGATPVVGNWNGDGKDDAAAYAFGAWFRDIDGNNQWNSIDVAAILYYGWNAPLVPVAGDWNTDGKDDVGIYNLGVWFRDLNGNGLWDSPDWSHLAFLGWEGALPVVGRWTGSGSSQLATEGALEAEHKLGHVLSPEDLDTLAQNLARRTEKLGVES